MAGQILIFQSIADTLHKAGIESPRVEARTLLKHICGISPEELLRNPNPELTLRQREALEEAVKRRATREPLSHILGLREFWGLPFKVSKDTLTPRPETETIIESALEFFPDKTAPLSIIDLGTGSGCIILSLLGEYTNASGLGIDQSDQALEIAKLNSINLALDSRVSLKKNHWGRGITQKFDLLVSNPPYIKEADIVQLDPEVRVYEPKLALSGGNDGLECYREIAPYTVNLLKPGGIAIFEIGFGQTDEVADIFRKNGFEKFEIRPDISGISRCFVIKTSK